MEDFEFLILKNLDFYHEKLKEGDVEGIRNEIEEAEIVKKKIFKKKLVKKIEALIPLSIEKLQIENDKMNLFFKHIENLEEKFENLLNLNNNFLKENKKILPFN